MKRRIIIVRRKDPVNVQEFMTRNVQSCGPDTNLAAAAKMMWDGDCGALPVVNIHDQVIGMITDRDICMAAATKNRPASDITAWEAMSGNAYTCRMSDTVHTALDIMGREKVRRLPVVDDDRRLRGIVAINDFILAAGKGKGKKDTSIPNEDVIRTMKEIGAHRILVGI